MNHKSQTVPGTPLTIGSVISCLFGIVAFSIGVINTFWGNDTGFGVFIVLLSMVYFPPLTNLLKEKTGLYIPAFVKILLGVFILWAALGVGELFAKIDMMVGA